MNIKSIGYKIKHFFMQNLVHNVIFFNFLMCSRNMAILKIFLNFWWFLWKKDYLKNK